MKQVTIESETIATTSHRKRVRFDESKPVYHEAPVYFAEDDEDGDSSDSSPIITPSALWYPNEVLMVNYQVDMKDTIKNCVKRAHKQGKKFTPKDVETAADDDICCCRGLELLSPEQDGRNVRGRGYRMLVLRQYQSLKKTMCGSHLHEMLADFARPKSQFFVDRALALAEKDAADARTIYHDTIRSNNANSTSNSDTESGKENELPFVMGSSKVLSRRNARQHRAANNLRTV